MWSGPPPATTGRPSQVQVVARVWQSSTVGAYLRRGRPSDCDLEDPVAQSLGVVNDAAEISFGVVHSFAHGTKDVGRPGFPDQLVERGQQLRGSLAVAEHREGDSMVGGLGLQERLVDLMDAEVLLAQSPPSCTLACD